MSERGSFCTEYVYCKQCFAAVKEVLERHRDDKYLNFTELDYYPIIAGKIGGIFAGEELFRVLPLDTTPARDAFGMELARAICHPIRIAVLPDGQQGQIIEIRPA